MDALDVERDDAGAAVGRRSVDRDPVELDEALDRVTRRDLLVLLDRLEADLGDVVDRGAHAEGLDERGRAGLELVREVVPGRLLDRDLADHLAAHLERRHALEQLAPAVERARAGRPAELVRREAEEVAAERLHVDAAVRDGLRGVDDHDRALLVRPGGEPVDRVDRAERVRDEVRGDDLDPACARDLVERRRSAARPCRRSPITRNSAPVRFAICCQGTKFAWCSSSVTTATSPGPRLSSPQA